MILLTMDPVNYCAHQYLEFRGVNTATYNVFVTDPVCHADRKQNSVTSWASDQTIWLPDDISGLYAHEAHRP